MPGVKSNTASGGVEAENPSPVERDFLLRTKLLIPQIRTNHVVRPRLIQKLNEGLEKSLTLISAPAGYGKTMLVAEWAARCPVPVGWVSLDGTDNDPERFLAYLTAALDKIQPGSCFDLKTRLRSSPALPFPAVLGMLINDIAEIPFSFALVLDDYQFIKNSSIHTGLTTLIDYLPPNMHLVITTREDPPLPLPRLRSRSQLVEIRERDLRFTIDELSAYLEESMRLELTPDEITALEARTEGWIVGIQMAAVALQARFPSRRGEETSHFIRAFSGSHRYILDYFIEEVFERQPEPIQAFLLQTSILEQMCGPLCEAVIRESEAGILDEQNRSFPETPKASQSILEYLERANLFVVALDDERRWFRYHHLFAELLNSRLKRSFTKEQVGALHQRASQWYEKQGLIASALQHSLAAGDTERLVCLLEQNVFLMITRGEITTLMEWLGKIPEGVIESRVDLLRVKIWGLGFSGKIGLAEPLFQKMESLLESQEPTPLSQTLAGEISMFRGVEANYHCEFSRAIDLCQNALGLLANSSLRVQAIPVFTLGDAFLAQGDLDAARQAFSRAGEMAAEFDEPWTIAQSIWELGFLDIIAGKLHRAEERYHEAYRIIQERLGLRPGSVGMLDSGMAHLLIEWNQLDAAQELLSKSLENMNWGKTMRWWESPSVIVPGYTLQARLGRLRGDLAGAFDTIQKAMHLSNEYDVYADMRGDVQAELALQWLAQGNLARALTWAGEHVLDEDERLPFYRESEQIARAHILLAAGKIDEASALLNRLVEAAEGGRRYGRLIGILVVQALALRLTGNTLEALKILERALLLAEPEGYLRVFLDEGQPMVELLKAVDPQKFPVSREYLRRILDAFREERGITAAAIQEPITEREREVLQWIAAGLTNQQIAEKLVLSPGTVKAHTANIYRKLDVQNRTEAVARARELDLLPR